MSTHEYSFYLREILSIIITTYKEYFDENVILQTQNVLNDWTKLLFSLGVFIVFMIIILWPIGKVILTFLHFKKQYFLISTGIGLIFLTLLEHFISYSTGKLAIAPYITAASSPIIFLIYFRRSLKFSHISSTIQKLKKRIQNIRWKSCVLGLAIIFISQIWVVPLYGTGIAKTEDGNMYLGILVRETGIHSAYTAAINQSVPPMSPYFDNAQLRYYYFASTAIHFIHYTTTIDPFVIQHLLIPEITFLTITFISYLLVKGITKSRILGIIAPLFIYFGGTVVYLFPKYQAGNWWQTFSGFKQVPYIVGPTYCLGLTITLIVIWMLLNKNSISTFRTSIISGIILSTLFLTKLTLAEPVIIALFITLFTLTIKYLLTSKKEECKRLLQFYGMLFFVTCFFGTFIMCFSMGFTSNTLNSAQAFIPGARISSILENERFSEEIDKEKLHITRLESIFLRPENRAERIQTVTRYGIIFVSIEFSFQLLGVIYLLFNFIRKNKIEYLFIGLIPICGILLFCTQRLNFFDEFQFMTTTSPIAAIFTAIPIYLVAHYCSKKLFKKKKISQSIALIICIVVIVFSAPTSLGELRHWARLDSRLSLSEYQAGIWIQKLTTPNKTCLINSYDKLTNDGERDIYLSGIGQCILPTATSQLAKVNMIYYEDPAQQKIELLNAITSKQHLQRYIYNHNINVIWTYKDRDTILTQNIPNDFSLQYENDEIAIYLRN